MSFGTLYGTLAESNGLYGLSESNGLYGLGNDINYSTYFEWFIFTEAASPPATPTGGSWDFLTNIGVPPVGWSSFIGNVPLGTVWMSIAFIDSRNPTVVVWSTPGLLSDSSVYATAYADVFTGNGFTVNWTMTANPVVINNLDVSINGVTQTPNTDYTFSTTTFTTTTAAPLGSIILVKYKQSLPAGFSGAASQITNIPAGGISATNVQAALNELDTEKATVIALAATNANIAILNGATGSANVGYTPAGTGAVATTVQTKLRESVSVSDYGASPGASAAINTAAFNAAFAAAGAYGTNGVVLLQLGSYSLNPISLVGTIGLTIKGKGGGGVGAGAMGSVLNFVNTTGDCLSISSATTYSAEKFVLEDISIKANTTGYALSFNGVASPAHPISEACISRVTITNEGGTTYNTGNGVKFSLAFYVYANKLNLEKLGSYIYSSGIGVSIDMGAATSFLGGEFNFTNCNFVNWYTGFQAGDQAINPVASELYPNINLIGCNPQGCGTGIAFYYGVVAALIQGCYIEGCLNYGIFVANQAKNVTIQSCFLNNSTATVADIAFGVNAVSTSYTQFYNCAVRDCIFLSVKNYGIFTYGTGTSTGIQNTLSVDNCNFRLAIAGAKAIASSSQPSSSNVGFQWFISAKNCNTYGFASGNGFNGKFTVLENCHEATTTGVPIIGYAHSGLVYGSYPTDYQILATDSETLAITNTRVGAIVYNAVPNTSKNRKQFIVNTSASTQSISVYYSNGVASGISLTPGGKILMWNDGQYEYISTL